MGVPDTVTIKVHAKVIEVEGPRDKLVCDFKHLNLDFQHLNLDFQLIKDPETGKRKRRSMPKLVLAKSAVQANVERNLKNHELMEPFATKEFIWFAASAKN